MNMHEGDFDDGPIRIKPIQRILDDWATEMLHPPNDARLLELTALFWKRLVRFRDAAIEPRDYMTHVCLYDYFLDADAVQAAFEKGSKLAEREFEARMRKVKANGAGGELLPSVDEAVLSLADWLKRDLPPPDPLLGHWFTTTTRALFPAPTGSGKSMLGIAAGMRMSGGFSFLRWEKRTARKGLYVDGEMSNRLLRDRLADEAKRLGVLPTVFHALSHEDVPYFAPLNTPAGQNMIEDVLKKIGEVEWIIFDNIMSLIAGDMKEEEGWRQTLPFIHSLTKRKIGQLWLHHTGHDETRGYGTKTREWQMDTMLFGERVERPDTDVSMKLEFRKARERTPLTRADFADITFALVDDEWVYSNASDGTKTRPSPLGQKFLDAFHNCDTVTLNGRRCVPTEAWRAECVRLGLIDREAKPDSARALFSKMRRELVTCNQIACNDDLTWKV